MLTVAARGPASLSSPAAAASPAAVVEWICLGAERQRVECSRSRSMEQHAWCECGGRGRSDGRHPVDQRKERQDRRKSASARIRLWSGGANPAGVRRRRGENTQILCSLAATRHAIGRAASAWLRLGSLAPHTLLTLRPDWIRQAESVAPGMSLDLALPGNPFSNDPALQITQPNPAFVFGHTQRAHTAVSAAPVASAALPDVAAPAIRAPLTGYALEQARYTHTHKLMQAIHSIPTLSLFFRRSPLSRRHCCTSRSQMAFLCLCGRCCFRGSLKSLGSLRMNRAWQGSVARSASSACSFACVRAFSRSSPRRGRVCSVSPVSLGCLRSATAAR